MTFRFNRPTPKLAFPASRLQQALPPLPLPALRDLRVPLELAALRALRMPLEAVDLCQRLVAASWAGRVRGYLRERRILPKLDVAD
jgi:hypothetical protein